MKKSKAKTKGKSWVFWLLSALIFGLMLGLNYLTPKMCDDFAYSQSFLTKEPLRSVFDIFPRVIPEGFNLLLCLALFTVGFFTMYKLSSFEKE